MRSPARAVSRHHHHLASGATLAGDTFNGWFVAPTGGSALTSPYTLAGSVTLYAQWSANATEPSPSTPRGEAAGSPARAVSKAPPSPSPRRPPWPATPSTAGSSPRPGDPLDLALRLAGWVTLYAPWSANATDTVTFNAEGGSAVASQSGLQGTTITLPAAPTLAGDTFNGWFVAPTGGSALTSPYTLAGSVTLYAQWSANATDAYSYTANGGSGTAPASGSGRDGTTITLAANPFTYPGHTFTGWSVAPSAPRPARPTCSRVSAPSSSRPVERQRHRHRHLQRRGWQ